MSAGTSRLRIKPAGHHFTDRVLADLMKIQRLPAGRATFRRLRDAGAVITIEKPHPAASPPNAWTKPAGSKNIVIAYDPAEWPCAALPDSPASDIILLRLLEEGAKQAVLF